MAKEEIWKRIPNFPYYEVSNYGNVHSIDRMVNAKLGSKSFKRGRILTKQRLSDGYVQVRLCNNGVTRFYRIHQLVAICFIKNPNGYTQINHINEVKDDNRVENLEWCDIKYNNNYGCRLERISNSMKNGKNSICVVQMNLMGDKIQTWVSMSEVQRNLGISNSKIAACCKGKRNKAGGYKWRYANETDYEL